MRIVTLLLVLVAACGPSLQQRALDDVTRSRNEAHARPGARQAQAYAEAIHAAHQAGAYKDRPQVLAADVDDALVVLDVASGSAGRDAGTLIAWRALILTDAGRYEQAFAEFERSMAVGPNLTAARNLILIWGTASKPDRVGEVCAATVPELAEVDDAYLLITECMQHMNALSDDAALAWASPDIVAWYRDERDRRQQAYAAELRARQRQDAREQEVVRETEICAADCQERGLRCQNKCYDDADCEERCVGIFEACKDRCVSDAYRKLGM
jgi:tetratricopeptide (TPR) repeat protein